MARKMRRRALLGGGAALVAGTVSRTTAASAEGDLDGSWTGVVGALEGGRAEVLREDGSTDEWRAVSSLVALRVGDLVAVGPTDVGGPSVVSPLFYEVGGRLDQIRASWAVIGGRRCELDRNATARASRTSAGISRTRSLRGVVRTGDNVHALCVVNHGDGSTRVATAYVDRLDDV